jgi:hypothetical protein
MLRINNDNVMLTRGDNADIVVTIYDMSGNVYTLQPGDVLVFTIKKNCITEDIIIQKDISSDSIIHMTPEDTNELAYGSYWFDVQLTMNGGEVYTVIEPHKFNVAKEVTF